MARRTTTLLLAVAQVATAGYLVVYLFRWQWNRALIAGVLLIATEVLLVGRVILQRMRAIEERLDQLKPEERIQVRLAETRPEPADRFRWLRDATTRTNVFLPLLLGAGVLASGAAWVVEGIARRTARPAMERSLSTALVPLAFPSGGFLAPTPEVAPVRRSAWRRVVTGIAALGVVVGIGLAVDVAADATQTRPDQLEEGVTTIVDVGVRGEFALRNPSRYAEDLMRVCLSQSFRREIPTVAVTNVDERTVRFVLDGDLGENGTERLRGCLDDVTLERLQANVAGITVVPSRGVR